MPDHNQAGADGSHPGPPIYPAYPPPPQYPAMQPPPPYPGRAAAPNQAQYPPQASTGGERIARDLARGRSGFRNPWIWATLGLLIFGIALKGVAHLADQAAGLPTNMPNPPAASGSPDKSHDFDDTLSNVAVGPSGWRMHIPSAWKSVDVPNLDEDAAWVLTGPHARPGDSVIVVAQGTPDAATTLRQFVTVTSHQLNLGTRSVQLVNPPRFTGGAQPHAMLEFTSSYGSHHLHQLMYVTRSDASFVMLTFSAHPKSFGGEVASVERVFSTLHAD